jgi:hypothetical protein
MWRSARNDMGDYSRITGRGTREKVKTPGNRSNRSVAGLLLRFHRFRIPMTLGKVLTYIEGG